MTKRDLRLQYSGLIIFVSRLLSVGTGLIFQFMIARVTTRHEYDVWFNLTDVATYFTLLATILPFWAMRFAAREKEGAIKTGILSNLIIALTAALIYAPLVPLITSALGISQEYVYLYFLITLQIVEIHAITVFESCLQVRIPKNIGHGLLIQQVCKVALGYLLIMQLKQPLLGAVIATLVAFLAQSAYYLRLLSSELRLKARLEYVKEWLKGSTANIVNVVGSQIAAVIFVFLFTLGGEGARGIYGAATQVAGVITYSSFLAFALYPKLLAERKLEDITVALKTVLMFAIPMTIGAVMLSNAYISILKPEYAGTGAVLIVLAVDAFVMVVSGVFGTVLFGMETLDETAKISVRKLARSKLFFVFVLPYLHSAITIPTTLYVLTTQAWAQPFYAALYVSIINSLARFIMFLVLLVLVRGVVRVQMPWKAIAKYLLAADAMAVFLLAFTQTTRISITLISTAIGGLLYLAILMVVDKETRALPITLWREIRNR